MEIEAVRTGSQLRQFLDLPYRLYPGLPWVPPLRIHLRLMMGRLHGFFLATENGRALGRIGARVHGDALHFGFFECMPGRPEVARALFESARALAPQLPLRGPYHFKQEEFYTGLLVQGFDSMPYFGVSYNPPYYEDYLLQNGLAPLKDLLTYRLTWDVYRPGFLDLRAERAAAQGISVRSLDPRRRRADIQAAVEVMNVALKPNWGFEEFTAKDVNELWLISHLFLDPDWLVLAEHQGRAVGTAILLPDYNPWLEESRGRITWRLLRHFLFGKKTLQRVRGWAMGVVPEARLLGGAHALMHGVLQRLLRARFREAEISWVLDDNKAMNNLLLSLGATLSRVHRLYESSPSHLSVGSSVSRAPRNDTPSS